MGLYKIYLISYIGY